MTLTYTVRPISDRTPFGGEQKSNPFRSTWPETLKLLDVELGYLEARDIVLEVDTEERHIRVDGMLRADAKVASGAVRLAFDSIHGPLTYATDRFYGAYSNDPPDWQINVRAIALGLEALRKIERYGIVKRDEQYAGFKQLGAGTALPASHMTSDQAHALIAELRDVPLEHLNTDPDSIRSSWHRARYHAHPDRLGGDRTTWDKLEEAGKVLGLI